jgi:hypothetical protein
MLARMDEDIPPLLPPEQMPPIKDQATLHHTWRALMGELGFAGPQLWVFFVDDHGRPGDVVTIKDVPARLAAPDAEQLIPLLREVGEGRAVAFLYARPGRGGRTADDLTWARQLTRTCRKAGLRVWPVHLATDREITVVAPDDLDLAG